MEKEKKDKFKMISLWVLLAVLVLFVVITTSVIKTRRQYLDDLTNKNQELEDKLYGQEESEDEKLKIF